MSGKMRAISSAMAMIFGSSAAPGFSDSAADGSHRQQPIGGITHTDHRSQPSQDSSANASAITTIATIMPHGRTT